MNMNIISTNQSLSDDFTSLRTKTDTLDGVPNFALRGLLIKGYI